MPKLPNQNKHVKGKHIEQLWLSYLEILPQSAGAAQIMETRRAFYAGAQGLLHSIIANLSPGPDESEPDLAMMGDIEKELSDFAKLVGRHLA
jgi:hypothetical protein